MSSPSVPSTSKSTATNSRPVLKEVAGGGAANVPTDANAKPQAAPAGATGGTDQVFAEARPRVDDFSFNKEVTAVFDDMLDRSVPFYQEIQRQVAELAVDFAQPGTNVYDLGCSTANSFLNIDRVMRAGGNGDAAAADHGEIRFIGVDASNEMLAKARAKLAAAGFTRPFELQQGDLNAGVEVTNASVAMLVLTLQFVRPLYRERIVRSIYEGTTENGCLILVEKVLGENSTFNRLFIKHYYEMKRRNGYSEMEISQKREALENVLIPYRLEENKELLRGAGFRHVDVFFKWYNFCGMIAMK
jgi:tRNA (cmo5U34)-methyltransferase